MTTPTFKIGDRARVAHDTVYGAKKGAEFTITHISTPLNPEGAYASGEGYPGGVWLTDLELVGKNIAPNPHFNDWERKFLEDLETAANVPASQLEDIKQTATLGEQLNIRDRHIAHINDLDAAIRRRNAQIAEQVKIIDAQKAQLAEYAADIEKLKAGASAWLELGRDLGHDDRDFEAVRAPFRSPITVNILRDLQKRIGEANAAKGFHEEGDILRRSQVIAYTNNISEGEQETNYANTAAALRSYATARLALITTEVAEAIEEVRTGHAVDETYYVAKGALEVDGEMQDLEVPATALSDPEDEDRDYFVAQLGEGPHKPEGVPSEVADVVIRAFDFAHEFGIDLAAMIEEKISYNKTRPHRHAKQF